MIYGLTILLLFVAAGATAIVLARSAHLRRVSLERIGLDTQPVSPVAVMIPEAREIESFPTRYHWAPVAAGVGAAAIVFFTPLPAPYMLGFGCVVGAIANLAEMYWADSRTTKIEAQLADAIDLMVASLRAGSALLAAIEAAVAEAESPLREELEVVVGRIRLGQSPALVVRELAMRVPLESFRLFAHTLLVHWETGGSLASSLRTVGRTIRDRLEVSRRISAQAVESQVSVIAVMGIAYGLAVFMWRTNPGPVGKLFLSQIGSYAALAVMVLQGIGMTWIWNMSRIRF